MKNSFLFTLFFIAFFMQNSITQAQIDKSKYWRTEQISNDIYVATDTNCIQHVYNNEGELLLSLDSPSHHFDQKNENLYFIINQNTTAYYWYYNQQLNLLEVDEVKVLHLKDKPYLWLKSGRNAQLLHSDLSVRLNLGEASFNSLGDYYWLDDPIEQEIRIYTIADDKELFSITGEEYEIYRGKFEGVTNGVWITFFANKHYIYTIKGNLNKDGYDACYLEEHYTKYYRVPITRLRLNSSYRSVIKADTTIILIGQKNKEDKLFYGLLDPIKGKEVLPTIYAKIEYESYGYFVIEKKGSDFVELIKAQNGRPIFLIPKKYEYIEVVDAHTALVKQGNYWFLYNIERQKCLEVEFDKYEQKKDFLYLQRFGLWSMYNLKTQQFDFLLGEIDEPLECVGWCDWLSMNYSENQNFDGNTIAKKRYILKETRYKDLFERSDLLAGRVYDYNQPVVFFNSNNIKFKISVNSEYQAHVHKQYLLYQDENGFHLIDTSGGYTFQNKAWEAAFIIEVVDNNKPYCLMLDEQGVGLWNPIEDSIQYIQTNEIHDPYFGIEIAFEIKHGIKKGYLAFPKGSKQPFILTMEYDDLHGVKVMRDGTCIAKVTKNKEMYWVDEQGNKLSNCE